VNVPAREPSMPMLLFAAILGALQTDAPKSPQDAVRPALQSFGYRDVTLNGGPLRRQVDTACDDYLRIPNDDLLKGFRQRTGKVAPGTDLGGWYSSDVFHVFGQILSGLARLHAATGDPALREKAEALLAGWAECIEPDGYFYYSRKPNAPHYIYDKTVGGLTDMIIHCQSKLATESLAKITAWAIKNLDRSNPYAFGGTEWYTLSENLYRAYAATGDQTYRDFAAVWHYTEYWDIYARRGDLFGDRGNGKKTGSYHAYSHVNTLGGAAQAYLHSGKQQFLDTIRNAHDELTAHQCFATGGFGPDEELLPAPAWRRKTDFTHNSFETQCGCFAVFKLCKYLLLITGEDRFGDWIERLVYNGIAATIPMSADGHVFYYSDYCALGSTKRNHGVGWSCCTGTRPMALADLYDLIYFRSAEDLYVNLYVPSTVVWNRDDGRITIHQVTRFPEVDSTELRISTARSATFALKLRAPAWLAGPLVVMVNGQPASADIDAHGWATVRRDWRDGDRLELSLPIGFASVPLDNTAPYPAVIMRGPVAMAVRRSATGGEGAAPLTEPDFDRALIPSPGEPLVFHDRTNPSVLVRAFYLVKQGEPYRLYVAPNRFPAHAAQFAGDDWRDSESFRFNDRIGASVEFSFQGRGIRWIGYRFDDACLAQVSIDAKPVATVDQYSPHRGQPFEWRSLALTAGNHKIKLTVLDAKPEASKGHFLNVAGFEVIP
jgi:uncharacterized protein